MNDTERERWVDNDEGLYNMMKSSRMSKRKFVRENRQMIDNVITASTKKAQRPKQWWE